MKLEIYKKKQGKHTRLATFMSVMFIGAVGAYELSTALAAWDATNIAYVRYGVPVLAAGLLAWLMFWIVNRPKTADFLIATEGEMKKVSWSSRKEVIGSTKVVMITTFILAVLLLAVDLVFQLAFQTIGVMPEAK